MPKLRQPTIEHGDAGSVPAELLNAGHAVWKSKSTTLEWLRRHSLTITRELDWGPINRRKASAVAWMREAGLVIRSANGHVGTDYRRGRELGLAVNGGDGAIRERMEYAGVKFLAPRDA